jgi:hypothetical protein
MILNWPTFVLQRRINVPLSSVERVLCSPGLLGAGTDLGLGPDALHVRLDGPFGMTFPPFGLDGASWRAAATVRSGRGRRLVELEIEINAWDRSSTEVVVRPRARHPYRWGGRRLRQYFRLSHLTADTLTHFLSVHAPSPTAPYPLPSLTR